MPGSLESRFPGRGVALAQAWRTTQLRHTWLRSLMGRYVDFDTITREALTQVLDEAGLRADDGLGDALLERYRSLPAYPDVAPALAALGPDRPVAILTNGRRATVEATVRAAGLADRIPVVLSVEDVEIYKPAPVVYRLAVDHFARPPGSIWFVSGNAWDCAGAAAAGLRAVRVQRSGPPGAELVGPPPDRSVDDLRQLVEVVAQPW